MALINLVVAYDIATDDRREAISRMLSRFGPRVQLSVFECQVRDPGELSRLRRELESILEPEEDQVRFYRLSESRFRGAVILGYRTLEERRDFWLV